VTDSTSDALRRLTHELGETRKMVQERLANDKVREKAFDQLYEELRQYKEDFLFQAEKPLLLDLLLFYDSMNWFQESLIKQEMSADVMADSFQYLMDELLEVLYRRDVIPVEEHPRFDATVHRAIKVQETDDESADYKVAQVLKRGFARAKKPLRPEEVVILRYRGKKG